MNRSRTTARRHPIRVGVAAASLSLATLGIAMAAPAHAATCSVWTPSLQRSGSWARGVATASCTGSATLRVTLYRNGWPTSIGSSSGTGWRMAYTAWTPVLPWDLLAVRSSVVSNV